MTSHKEESLPSVSSAEWEVIETLWDNGPLAARDVFAALPAGHGWAYKTVKTLLSRLVAKGAVDYQQVGNSYLYRAVYSRDQMTHKEVKGFVERVLDGASLPILARLIEREDLSDDQIADLRRLLAEKERKSLGKEERRPR
ncbi:BlaI/MecI/CopY family transcriptional regulator [Candidatus Sumerlaeota bacterium]|nr:BlaI/MecI/CopY family transcriptional regulator [Candidatus Sumerlaeota bacterium]